MEPREQANLKAAEQSEIKERESFLDYKKWSGGLVVAIFKTRSGEEFAIDRETLEERLENLKRQNLPYENTERALLNWPTNVEGLPSANAWHRERAEEEELEG